MNGVTSITTVNTSSGLAVRQINGDGSELFVLPEIYEPRYSKEQAEKVAESLKHHLDAGGKTYAKPLPAGVKVLG